MGVTKELQVYNYKLYPNLECSSPTLYIIDFCLPHFHEVSKKTRFNQFCIID